MLHDVGLHDVIGGHQAYIHRKIDTFMAHRILHLAKTTRGSRDPRARKEIINSLRSRPSGARFARINCLPIISLTFTDSCRRAANMNKTGCILHLQWHAVYFVIYYKGIKASKYFQISHHLHSMFHSFHGLWQTQQIGLLPMCGVRSL